MTPTHQSFRNATSKIQIKDPALLDRALSYTSDRTTKQIAGQRLMDLAEKRNPHNPTVTNEDFYQAIEDFSDTADFHAANLDEKEAQIARNAFNVITQVYINMTDDVDVFAKSQRCDAVILGKDLRTEMPDKKRPDPHLAQQAIKTNTPINRLGR